MNPVTLSGGRSTIGVVRIGDTVRRPITRDPGFAHALLRHLERRGFDAAPRLLGVDADGREMLSFVPGTVPRELDAHTDPTLAAAAALLRRFHDATADRRCGIAAWRSPATTTGHRPMRCSGTARRSR